MKQPLVMIASMGLSLFAAYGANAQDVDCGAGGSIQAQLNTGDRFVTFVGTCNESVVIFGGGNGVTIQGVSGDPALDVITGGAGAIGVGNVRFENLTVRGSGIIYTGGASGRVANSIVDNTVNGVAVTRGSSVVLDGVTITPTTGQTFNNCPALCAGDSSSVQVFRSTITDNVNEPALGGAVVAFRSSQITLREGTVVTNNGSQAGVAAIDSSDIRIDQTNPAGGGVVQVNGGLRIERNSNLDVRAGTINGNTVVSLRSAYNLGSAFDAGGLPENITVNGDTTMEFDSSMRVQSAETASGTSLAAINGRITCADRKSSFDGTFAGVRTISCSDFNGRRIRE